MVFPSEVSDSPGVWLFISFLIGCLSLTHRPCLIFFFRRTAHFKVHLWHVHPSSVVLELPRLVCSLYIVVVWFVTEYVCFVFRIDFLLGARFPPYTVRNMYMFSSSFSPSLLIFILTIFLTGKKPEEARGDGCLENPIPETRHETVVGMDPLGFDRNSLCHNFGGCCTICEEMIKAMKTRSEWFQYYGHWIRFFSLAGISLLNAVILGRLRVIPRT